MRGERQREVTMSIAFTDKRGRHITIEADFDIRALHDGIEIGRIDFDDNDVEVFLWDMQVHRRYRRAGIATAMLRAAVHVHGRAFGKPALHAPGGSQAQAHEYFTQEGAALIHYCIEQGILDETIVE
jgi:GNAT superfamily N-acetyltransferase